MSYEDKLKYVRVMYVFDVEENGFLNFDNFIKGIQRASPDINKEQAEEIYKSIDKNENGYLEFNEFIQSFLEDDIVIK